MSAFDVPRHYRNRSGVCCFRLRTGTRDQRVSLGAKSPLATHMMASRIDGAVDSALAREQWMTGQNPTLAELGIDRSALRRYEPDLSSGVVKTDGTPQDHAAALRISFKGAHRHRAFAACLMCCAGLGAPAAAIAAPSDFRVLTDDISEPGEFGLEIQQSVARPRIVPGQATLRALQGLTEIAYGLGKQWELSLQLPVSRFSGTTYGNGANVELTYMAPHDSDTGFYWGGRVELGRAKPVGETADWTSEWRPILGYREGHWHAVVNAGMAMAVTGPDRRLSFEPSAKLSYRTAPALSVGFEYYLDAGPLSRFRSSNQRQELGLLVLDAKLGGLEVNLGVGKGFTSGSDNGVLKLLVSWALD